MNNSKLKRKNSKNMENYEYKIQQHETDKLNAIEQERLFIQSQDFIIAPDGPIPNSIIRKKINCTNFKTQ